MPSRFERYRVVDGKTPLAARYFNPVFQDLDLRLASLEEVRISWDTAVKEVVKFGLTRIDELITEPLREVSQLSNQAHATSAQLEQLRQLAQDRTAILAALIESLEQDTAAQIAAFTTAVTVSAGADIDTWKAARTTELDAWVASFHAQLDAAARDISAAIASLPQLQRSERIANTTLVKADNGKLIDITAGTFVQTISAAAELGAGWWCWLRNAGTGDITLDPNGAETIDGRTSYVMYPGEMRLVQCDGAALRTVVLNGFYRVWAMSADFVKPPGYRRFVGDLWGGGGSGRKAASTTAAGGGGAAWSPIDLLASSLVDTAPIVIAAATPGPTTADTNGVAGSASSFAGVVANGGNEGGLGTSAPGGISVFADGLGGIGRSNVAPTGMARGGGGGAGFSASGTSAFAGGLSEYGGKGGGNGTTTSGEDGEAPGGGGGATRTGPKAGDGARGELRLWGVF